MYFRNSLQIGIWVDWFCQQEAWPNSLGHLSARPFVLPFVRPFIQSTVCSPLCPTVSSCFHPYDLLPIRPSFFRLGLEYQICSGLRVSPSRSLSSRSFLCVSGNSVDRFKWHYVRVLHLNLATISNRIQLISQFQFDFHKFSSFRWNCERSIL